MNKSGLSKCIVTVSLSRMAIISLTMCSGHELWMNSFLREVNESHVKCGFWVSISSLSRCSDHILYLERVGCMDSYFKYEWLTRLH